MLKLIQKRKQRSLNIFTAIKSNTELNPCGHPSVKLIVDVGGLVEFDDVMLGSNTNIRISHLKYFYTIDCNHLMVYRFYIYSEFNAYD